MFNSKFIQIVEQHLQALTEADEAPVQQTPDATTDPNDKTDSNQVADTPPAEPQPPQKASPGFTYLTNIIFAALRVPTPKSSMDIRFSDNEIHDARQAQLALQVVSRNLPSDVRNSIAKMGGEARGDLDTGKLIEGATLAIKALFLTNKDGNQGDIAFLTNLDFSDVDPQNPKMVPPEKAQEIYTKIQSYLSAEMAKS